MSILFLDIDGVLAPHGNAWPSGCGRIMWAKVQLLNVILHDCPEAQIVLTSSWRHQFHGGDGIETLLLSHGVDCKGRVWGLTDLDPMHEVPDTWTADNWLELGTKWRPRQIIDFIVENCIDNHVVLDDLPLEVPHLVQTDPEKGLTIADVKRALRILGRAS